MSKKLYVHIPSQISGPDIPIPPNPTHSADMGKDSIVQTIDDMDSTGERKGVIVTIFVKTCICIIVTILVVALILKVKMGIYS